MIRLMHEVLDIRITPFGSGIELHVGLQKWDRTLQRCGENWLSEYTLDPREYLTACNGRFFVRYKVGLGRKQMEALIDM